MKIQKMTVECYPDKIRAGADPSYKVVKVQDSVAYHPGQTLTHEQIERACTSAMWNVSIVEPKK